MLLLVSNELPYAEILISHHCTELTFSGKLVNCIHELAELCLNREYKTAQEIPDRGFGKAVVKSRHPPASELSPPNSSPIPGPLSKVRRLAEILEKNYIIITQAALRGEANPSQ